VKYEKAPILRMLAHLEVARVLERACRRSGLPVAMSQGFRPHQKITFATNLPVGVASEVEYADIGLAEEMSTDSVRECLVKALPEGMLVSAVATLPVGTPALQSQDISSTFQLYSAPDEAIQTLEAIQSADVIQIIRKKGTKDLVNPGRFLNSVQLVNAGNISASSASIQVELVTLATGGGLGVKDLLAVIREMPGGSGVWAKRVGLSILSNEGRKDPLDI